MITVPKCLTERIELPHLLNILPGLGAFLQRETPFLIPNHPWIAVEGVDGSGKGAFIQCLRERLNAASQECSTCQMPGGTPLGARLRELMKATPAELTGDDTIVHAMAANTSDMLTRVIAPELRAEAALRRLTSKSRWLVSDRWPMLSGAVYQRGYFTDLVGGEIVMEDVARAYGPVCPPLLVYMRVTSETSLRRRPVTRHGDQFERSEDERHEQVAAYERLFSALGGVRTQRSPDGSITSNMNWTMPIIFTMDNNLDVPTEELVQKWAKGLDDMLDVISGVLRAPKLEIAPA